MEQTSKTQSSANQWLRTIHMGLSLRPEIASLGRFVRLTIRSGGKYQVQVFANCSCVLVSARRSRESDPRDWRRRFTHLEQ